jgi:hypothetical protein
VDISALPRSFDVFERVGELVAVHFLSHNRRDSFRC